MSRKKICVLKNILSLCLGKCMCAPILGVCMSAGTGGNQHRTLAPLEMEYRQWQPF